MRKNSRYLQICLLPLALLSCTALAIAAPAKSVKASNRYLQAGKLIATGRGRLNFYCLGSGSPTVIFDAGWEDWSPAWVKIQPAIARYTRACTYDRAGYGFSPAGPMPRTSVEIARELHATLHKAGIAPPYLLVGHSFGSYTLRTFADLYMPEVYGLVLVDGESGDLESARKRAQDDASFASTITELRACRAAIEGHRPLPPIPMSGHSYTPKPATPCSHQFFRGLPMPEFSPQLNAVALHIANTRVALYNAAISEMREMPYDEQWLITHRRSFVHRPIRILTAQNHHYDTANTPPAIRRQHQAEELAWTRVQRRYLPLSTDSRQILAMKSGHYIQLDQPYLVIDAIRRELPASALAEKAKPRVKIRAKSR